MPISDKLTPEEKKLKEHLEKFDYSTVMTFGEVVIRIRDGKGKLADIKKTVILETE